MNAGGFNNRLQATTFEVKKNTTQIIAKTYEYHADGMLKKETDGLNDKFDRLYGYDHAGRMASARSGANARGQTGNALYIPFKNDFQYNAFGSQTQDQYAHFTRNGTVNLGYANNRITTSAYDFDGNLTGSETSSPNKVYKYDASGRMSGTSHEYTDTSVGINYINIESLTYDGNGLLLKTATSQQENGGTPETDANYSIRSTVLQGEVISTVNKSGGISATYIRANGTVVAVENVMPAAIWMHKDPAMSSMRSTNATGQVNGNIVGGDFDAMELDPSGKSLGFDDPYAYGVPAPEAGFVEPFESFGAMVNGQWTTFTVDGMQVPRSHFNQMTEFAFQGFFGLIERQARLSAPRLVGNSVSSDSGFRSFDNNSSGLYDAHRFAIEENNATWNRTWAVSEGWAVSNLLSPPRDAKVIGLDMHKPKIDAQLNRMGSAACAKAFRDANLHTPNEVTEAGLTIFDSNLLNSPTNNNTLGMSDDYRTDMMKMNGTSISINDVTSPWGQGNNGMLFMALTPRVFTGNDTSFEEIFTHAMMHAAGALGRLTHPETRAKRYRISTTPEDFRILEEETVEVANRGSQHDLTWIRKDLYDEIIKNCTK